MPDLSAYENLNTQPGPTCKLPALLAELRELSATGGAREREAEEFLAALAASERVQSSAIVARLASLGVTVSHTFVRRHRGAQTPCRRCVDVTSQAAAEREEAARG